MERKAREVAEQFGASSVDAVKTLKAQFDSEDSAYKTAFDNYKEAEKNYFSSFIEHIINTSEQRKVLERVRFCLYQRKIHP